MQHAYGCSSPFELQQRSWAVGLRHLAIWLQSFQHIFAGLLVSWQRLLGSSMFTDQSAHKSVWPQPAKLLSEKAARKLPENPTKSHHLDKMAVDWQHRTIESSGNPHPVCHTNSEKTFKKKIFSSCSVSTALDNPSKKHITVPCKLKKKGSQHLYKTHTLVICSFYPSHVFISLLWNQCCGYCHTQHRCWINIISVNAIHPTILRITWHWQLLPASETLAALTWGKPSAPDLKSCQVFLVGGLAEMVCYLVYTHW